jgi:hypothetical protein
MNGFISKWMPAAFLAGGLGLVCGCDAYRNVVDPCYPERYEFAAREEVHEAIAPQVNNGHVLDQTIWNDMFEPGTAKLTPGGMDHLTTLVRRRPCPDTVVYLQVAEDIPYDPAAPDKFAAARVELDGKRIVAVQNYLTAQTAGRHLVWEVIPHDPGEVGQAAVPVGISVQRMYAGAQGLLPSTAGAGAVNVAGGAGAAGAGGAPGGSGR